MPQFDAYDEATSADTGDLFVMDDVSAGATKKIKAENMPGSGGTVREIVIPFAFDTPGLLTGAALYTPTVGDSLLDAWIEIDTAWNGTTPLGDFGMFTAGQFGWLGWEGGPRDMTVADGTGQSYPDSGILSETAPPPSGQIWRNFFPAVPSNQIRTVAKFTTADPIKVCVSQDGTNTGADPGSTQGAAVLHLLVSTPTTPTNVLAGVPVVRKFPFAYNTPNILTGAAVYTPTIGDVLLDAWIEVVTAWNGTSPSCDVGQFTSGDVGWFNAVNAAIDVTAVDSQTLLGAPMLSQAATVTRASGLAQASSYPSAPSNTYRAVPAKFTTADPVKVCVSQGGINDGDDPGSSQGSAVLYLVTATPI